MENLKTGFKDNWITIGADDEMVRFSEDLGKELASGGLTRTQIRGIYSEIKRIQSSGFNRNKSAFFLLKPKVAYVYGRTLSKSKNGLKDNPSVRTFKDFFNIAWEAVNKAIRNNANEELKIYDNFCALMEAVLAFHRTHGGQ